MPKFRKHTVAENAADRQKGEDEFDAYVWNRHLDTQNAIVDRTMTRDSYYKLKHWIRYHCWRISKFNTI